MTGFEEVKAHNSMRIVEELEALNENLEKIINEVRK